MVFLASGLSKVYIKLYLNCLAQSTLLEVYRHPATTHRIGCNSMAFMLSVVTMLT